MKWKVPTNIQKNTWSVIQYDDHSVVVPSTDSASHNIEGFTCTCDPRVEVTEGVYHVVHNSWLDKQEIERSLKTIFK